MWLKHQYSLDHVESKHVKNGLKVIYRKVACSHNKSQPSVALSSDQNRKLLFLCAAAQHLV